MSFSSLERIPGTRITSDSRSGVSRIELDQNYYVKIFRGRGNRWHHLLRRDRYSVEIRNLEYFSSLGIATPTIVATGHRKVCGLLAAGVLVTREVENSQNLLEYLQGGKLYSEGPANARQLLTQLANILRKLHAARFYAADIKPRNILVARRGQEQILVFFDCPRGRRLPGFLFRHNANKDLAHLFRDMRESVRKTDLLRAYKQYLGCEKLSPQQKQRATQVITYYDRRRETRERRGRLSQSPSPRD